MDWLHFIGRKYYPSFKIFLEEAKHHGITRRVSYPVLKRMNFGDHVFLAMREGAYAVVYAYFRINEVSGLGPETVRQIKERFQLATYDLEPIYVERGCGSYFLHQLVRLNDSIEMKDVIEIMESVKETKGLALMVGCTPDQIRVLDFPVRLRLPFSMGFRPFDGKQFLLDVAKLKKNLKRRSKKILSGVYYPDMRSKGSQEAGELDAKIMQVIDNYFQRR